jgi:hypothetical protein
LSEFRTTPGERIERRPIWAAFIAAAMVIGLLFAFGDRLLG